MGKKFPAGIDLYFCAFRTLQLPSTYPFFPYQLLSGFVLPMVDSPPPLSWAYSCWGGPFCLTIVHWQYFPHCRKDDMWHLQQFDTWIAGRDSFRFFTGVVVGRVLGGGFQQQFDTRIEPDFSSLGLARNKLRAWGTLGQVASWAVPSRSLVSGVIQ